MGWRFLPSRFARQFRADAQTLFSPRLHGEVSLSDRANALDRIAGSLFLLCMVAAAVWAATHAVPYRLMRYSLLSEIARAESQATGLISVAEMRALQGRLKALGYDPGAIDGRAGPSTLRALNQYRASKLLGPVSYVDRTTVADLLN
jgi:putative peptidoglycan binding protein